MQSENRPLHCAQNANNKRFKPIPDASQRVY